MRAVRTLRCTAALVAASTLAGTPVHADGAVIIQESRLHNPPDSHEPQTALVELRNTGTARVADVTVLCTFTGAGGAALATQTARVADLAGGAGARAEAIYYGWPRAGAVACRLAEAP